MNLIKKQYTKSPLDLFREIQYQKIPHLIINGIDYLIELGLEYDSELYDGTINSLNYVDDYIYSRIKHFATQKLTLKHINEKNTYFVSISIPKLIQNSFFQLNSVYYIPMLYITDEPIVMKERSTFLYSLYQPITLYFEQNRTIFMGMNIPMSDFLQVITHDWPIEARDLITDKLKIDLSNNIQNAINHLSEKLNCIPTIESIKERINLLFFDNWTSQLYSKFYDFEGTIDNILKTAIRRNIEQEPTSFIDLRYKRLAFIEPIMKPFSKAIGDAAKHLLKGVNIKSLKLNLDSIVDHFFKELDGNVLYDNTNGFSSILSYKASFKNPYGQSKLPKQVSSIHWTHKGRICTNSIANNNPGENISLVPQQNIDLDYGIFKFSEEELLNMDNLI